MCAPTHMCHHESTSLLVGRGFLSHPHKHVETTVQHKHYQGKYEQYKKYCQEYDRVFGRSEIIIIIIIMIIIYSVFRSILFWGAK